ncbi:hypothetical protein I6E29_05800 [Arcanobacterium haemolyticum]|nr:hypothetical protein [Arcanobacterium haemolyticum]
MEGLEEWLEGLEDNPWFVGVFFTVTVIIILISVVPGPFIRLFSSGRSKAEKYCTEATVGVIRSTRQTEYYVNENPELRVELDAISPDGSTFVTTVKQVIHLSKLADITKGTYLPIRFNPQRPTEAIFDEAPNPGRIQELVQRQQTFKHPRDFTFEQRMEIVRHGVERKALLKDLRLTGVVEAGEHEAVVTVEPAGPEFEGRTLTRTTYLTDDMLEYFVPGRYIDITVVPYQPELFSLNFSFPFVTAIS